MNIQGSSAVTVYTARPSFQGSTLHTWIGFKRFMYLAEEAVLEYFRERGWGPHQLYQEYGLCFEIVDSAVRIFHPLNVDDVVRVEVRADQATVTDECTLAVKFFIDRDGQRIKPLSGRVRVLFRRANAPGSEADVPKALTPYIHTEINRASRQPLKAVNLAPKSSGALSDETIICLLVPPGNNAFVWKWCIPYHYCHYWDRIQHSGYVAILEQVVSLFLADRGISIRTMLETYGWIPVVSEAQVEILGEARMEETLYTVYTVEEIFKDLTYTARVDCYVLRDTRLFHTASGHIVHGYAQIRGRQNWGLAQFDATVLCALQGKRNEATGLDSID